MSGSGARGSIEDQNYAITFYLRLASGYDLSACSVLADVIRSFKRKKPPPPCRGQVGYFFSAQELAFGQISSRFGVST